MTIETEVAALTSATTALLDAVNVRKTALDTAEVNAAASAASSQTYSGNSAASAAAAAANQTATTTLTNTATTKAAEAAASAAAAASAVLGQTTSKLVLDVVDQTVFASATLVDAVIYETRKDSDGGAWRKRCQHTSWYWEAIYGKWLGSAANEAAARAVSGATTNDYYYDTTAAKFYALNAGSGRTEVFRGNVREFPARVLITAEATRVVIWDLTQPGCPMWMVLTHRGTGALANVVAVAALGGRVVLASVASIGLSSYSFLRDGAWINQGGGQTTINGALVALRNTGTLTGTIDSSINLVNSTVNDVALTVLPAAVSDPLSGMAVPTIAAATDGNDTYSISVIKSDGTVANIGADSSTRKMAGVAFIGKSLRAVRDDGTAYVWNDVTNIATGAAPSATYSATSVPALMGAAAKVDTRAFGSATGLTRIRENPSNPALSSVDYTTTAFATGHLPGDIRLAAITAADGVSETLVGAELVTNGTFDVDTAGWSAEAGTVAEWDAGAMKVTRTTLAKVKQTITLVIGKTYAISVTMTSGTGTGRLAMNGSDVLSATGTAQYTATASSNQIELRSSADTTYCWFDNISVREVIPDRSVKNNGLVINGSLTKAPVASGAGLCWITNFNGPAGRFLSQPYSANLDFGTGDFSVLWWEAPPAAGDQTYRFSRGTLLGCNVDGTTNYRVTVGGTGINTGAAAPAGLRFMAIVRQAGVLSLYGNASLLYSAANTANVSGATEEFRVGTDVGALWAGTKLALLRLSATAVSPDQLKHIYETERKLFEPGAQCAIAGNSNAVTALTYDEDTDLLHVGTSWGRSAFQGLVRVSSEATPVGSIKALAASGGTVVQAGATAADIYIPAYSLREELERQDKAAKALGSQPVFHEFDAVTSQTAFVVPAGFKVIAVYSAGALKRVGSTKDYTTSTDGFRETVNFAVAPGNGVWVSIMTVRSN